MGRVAAAAILLVAAVVASAGCGGGGDTQNEGSSTTAQVSPGSAGAIVSRPGEDVALQPGTSDYQTGPVRVVFLVVDSKGRVVERPRARVWVARSLEDKPFTQATAALENVGLPGKSEAALGGVTRLYVAHVRVPVEGTYVLVAEPVGGKPIQGALELEVKDDPAAPGIGEKAFPSHTPTIASTGGDFAALTTRKPPDVGLLRYSVADSLAAHAPFVVAFATPAFCTSRTCGPVVDVVDHVRKRFKGTGVRFIHVEIYKDNLPGNGENRWVQEWNLPTEPWVFVVGRDERIKERFEGSVSAGELEAAVRRHLLG